MKRALQWQQDRHSKTVRYQQFSKHGLFMEILLTIYVPSKTPLLYPCTPKGEFAACCVGYFVFRLQVFRLEDFGHHQPANRRSTCIFSPRINTHIYSFLLPQPDQSVRVVAIVALVSRFSCRDDGGVGEILLGCAGPGLFFLESKERRRRRRRRL